MVGIITIQTTGNTAVLKFNGDMVTIDNEISNERRRGGLIEENKLTFKMDEYYVDGSVKDSLLMSVDDVLFRHQLMEIPRNWDIPVNGTDIGKTNYLNVRNNGPEITFEKFRITDDMIRKVVSYVNDDVEGSDGAFLYAIGDKYFYDLNVRDYRTEERTFSRVTLAFLNPQGLPNIDYVATYEAWINQIIIAIENLSKDVIDNQNKNDAYMTERIAYHRASVANRRFRYYKITDQAVKDKYYADNELSKIIEVIPFNYV